MRGFNFSKVHLFLVILVSVSYWADAKRKSCRNAAKRAFPKLQCSRAKMEQECTDFCQNHNSCQNQTITKIETVPCPNLKKPAKLCCCDPCNVNKAKLKSGPIKNKMSTKGSEPSAESHKPKGSKLPQNGWATNGMSVGNGSSWAWTKTNTNDTATDLISQTSTTVSLVASANSTEPKGEDYNNDDYLDDKKETVKHNNDEEGDNESMAKRDSKLDISQPDCRANILRKYPEAECSRSKSKETCRAICEGQGDGKCQGSQGEIHKLNCRGERPDSEGLITCCCSVKCESATKTKARLEEEFNNENDEEESSGICLEVPRDDIKARLKEECKTNDEVFVARKYCTEEKEGSYFCVKDGKCFGAHCKGCLKHECEIAGNKAIMNPPKAYMDEHLKSRDFDKNVTVNVDDMDGVIKNKQWCTQLKDRADCKPTCKEFGDRLCGGLALKYDHDDYCKRDAKECKCCCQPVCKPGVSTDPMNLMEPKDPDHEDAIAKSVETDYKQDKSESQDYESEAEDDYQYDTSNYEMESSTSGAESNFQRR